VLLLAMEPAIRKYRRSRERNQLDDLVQVRDNLVGLVRGEGLRQKSHPPQKGQKICV